MIKGFQDTTFIFLQEVIMGNGYYMSVYLDTAGLCCVKQ